ncbi:hypothetical protein AALA80_14005, partial [Oscillospiraceae bacterium 50-60]
FCLVSPSHFSSVFCKFAIDFSFADFCENSRGRSKMLPSLPLARGHGKLPGSAAGGNTICPLGIQILSVAKASTAPLHLCGTTTKLFLLWIPIACIRRNGIAAPFESAAPRWIAARPQCFCRYRDMYFQMKQKPQPHLYILFACMPSVDRIK